MITRLKLSIVLLMAGSCGLYAQQSDKIVKSINAIKSNSSYIYAETTTRDQEEAYNGAMSILEMQVVDWVRAQHPDEIIEVCVIKAKEHSLKLETRRGSFYRAFVYVKKDDIMTATDQSTVTVVNMDAIDVVAMEKTTTSEDIDAAEVKKDVPEVPKITLTSEEERMKAVKAYAEISNYIKGLEKRGELMAYGKYKNMPTDEDSHLFVYNKSGEVVATLRKTSENLLNLKTLKEDDIKNYKNCGAIWFQLK